MQGKLPSLQILIQMMCTDSPCSDPSPEEASLPLCASAISYVKQDYSSYLS